VTPPQSVLDDLITLLTLVSVSCEFDAGRRCEIKLDIDGQNGIEGELCLRCSPAMAEVLKLGDVYGSHIRRL
jgi:hypothetical protein